MTETEHYHLLLARIWEGTELITCPYLEFLPSYYTHTHTHTRHITNTHKQAQNNFIVLIYKTHHFKI